MNASSAFEPVQQFSSTDAKQRFGELLKAAEKSPVAIGRHGKVAFMVGAPGFFSASPSGADALAARNLARLKQAMVEKDRLIRHQRIALDLLTLPAAGRKLLIGQALATVERWRREQLCSLDYIDRWDDILRMPVPKMAIALASDLEGWGTSLRQNSPFVGVHS